MQDWNEKVLQHAVVQYMQLFLFLNFQLFLFLFCFVFLFWKMISLSLFSSISALVYCRLIGSSVFPFERMYNYMQLPFLAN